ncbi:hypothetical protein FRC04_011492 [Tulasnella sp. 424]|nr:hypothetical protein FRC04_011492 [Tulasnella sp. 424]KAG8971702.1 hypothetical protein FRC05_010868 [Tulasnella sp. 425]
MQLLRTLAVVLTSALAVSAGKTKPAPKPVPLKWGVLAFPRYVGLDAYGPLELLNIVAFNTPNMTLSIIAETLDPVPAHITNSAGPLTYVKPTYTIDQDPQLDVLLIPGGPGSRIAYNNTRIIDYVKRTYPKLQYIVSVCTGAQILAKAGILTGKRATTNKFSWAEMVASGPGVNWVPCARWVVDGNIWTSSGVAAGIDLSHAFVSQIYKNETLADKAANILEIEIHKDPHWDPFCKIWNTTAGGTPMTMSM